MEEKEVPNVLSTLDDTRATAFPERKDEDILKERFKTITARISPWLTHKHNLALLGILMFGIALRLYFFWLTKTQPLWWDETSYGFEAKIIGLGVDLISNHTIERPILLPLIWAFVLFIGGNEILMRFVLVMFSVTGIVFTYLLTRQLLGEREALAASFMLSVFWLHLFFTNRLLQAIPATTFLLIGIFFLWKGYIKKERTLYTVLGAVFLACSFLTRGAGLIVLGGIFLFIIVTEKLSFLKRKDFWIVAGILILLIGPYVVFLEVTQGSILGSSRYFSPGSDYPTFREAMGISGLFGYLSLFPNYFTWPHLIFLIIGTGIIFLEIILTLDLHKKPTNAMKANWLLFFWITIYFLFFSMQVNHIENRYLMLIFPALLIVAGKGTVIAYDFLKKYHTMLALIGILALLTLGAYQQITYAQSIINVKSTSYGPVAQGGIWIKEHSTPEEGVISKSRSPMKYYAERETYPADDENCTDFEEIIADHNVKYFVSSIFEPHQQCYLDYPAQHQDRFIPVQIYFQDAAQTQPVLIVYEIVNTGLGNSPQESVFNETVGNEVTNTTS